jgi:hypothetical protein
MYGTYSWCMYTHMYDGYADVLHNAQPPSRNILSLLSLLHHSRSSELAS